MKKSLAKRKGEGLMKGEDYMLKKIGTESAFHAPRGYFENLTSEIMNRLPEEEEPASEKKEVTMWERAKPWVYMVAIFTDATLVIRVASSNHASAASDCIVTDRTKVEMEYIDMTVDNTTLDDYLSYVYLADSDAE